MFSHQIQQTLFSALASTVHFIKSTVFACKNHFMNEPLEVTDFTVH